jgi:hypothetical protein
VNVQQNTAGLLLIPKLHKKLVCGFMKKNAITDRLEKSPGSSSKQSIVIDDMNNGRQKKPLKDGVCPYRQTSHIEGNLPDVKCPMERSWTLSRNPGQFAILIAA